MLRYELVPIDFSIPLPGAADVAADSNGFILALAGPGPIDVFDPEGQLLGTLGEGIVRGGHGLFIDGDDNLYIADSGDHTVKKLSRDGRLLMTLGNPGHPSDTGVVNGNFKTIRRGAGPFNVPDKVCVSAAGEIFVTDGYGNARVHRFSADGRLLASWGEPGGEPGQFRIPHGVGVDSGNRVYVADRENERIQVFDVNGRLLEIWNDIARPDGLCVFEDHIYVGELGYRMFTDNVMFQPRPGMMWSRVRVFSPAGEVLACFGDEDGAAPGNLFSAHSMNVDREGCIYVADAGWVDEEMPRPAFVHPAIQKFRPVESMLA